MCECVYACACACGRTLRMCCLAKTSWKVPVSSDREVIVFQRCSQFPLPVPGQRYAIIPSTQWEELYLSFILCTQLFFLVFFSVSKWVKCSYDVRDTPHVKRDYTLTSLQGESDGTEMTHNTYLLNYYAFPTPINRFIQRIFYHPMSILALYFRRPH